LVSDRIWARWFGWPEIAWLSPLPVLSAVLLVLLWRSLYALPRTDDRGSMAPFAYGTGLFTLAFLGLAWSFYPYVVPERITIYEAASAPESLWIILIGTLVVLPMILAYTALAYWVFRGKATDLRYD
jgi:cytochrome bd ubiquinol oxidase subunit II